MWSKGLGSLVLGRRGGWRGPPLARPRPRPVTPLQPGRGKALHSPQGPGASGRRTRRDERPVWAAHVEAQGQGEARGYPGTQEPAGRSQQGRHGSAVPTAEARCARRTGGARDGGVARRGRVQRPGAPSVGGRGLLSVARWKNLFLGGLYELHHIFR